MLTVTPCLGESGHAADCIAAECLGALCRVFRNYDDPQQMWPRLSSRIKASPVNDDSISVWSSAISYSYQARARRGQLDWLLQSLIKNCVCTADLHHRMWLNLLLAASKTQAIYGQKLDIACDLVHLATSLLDKVSAQVRPIIGTDFF